MLVGLTVSAIVAGVMGLLVGLSFGFGVAFAALGYVAGGLCGCLLFARLAVGSGDPDLR